MPRRPVPRHRRRARLATVLLAVLALGALSVLPTPPPASAVARVSVERATRPVVSGSLVRRSIENCTAGPILLNASDQRSQDRRTRATRYIAVPKTCFAVGEHVALGNEVLRTALVLWASPSEDFEILKVDPAGSRGPGSCHTLFKGFTCRGTDAWIPQAKGMIVTRDFDGHLTQRPYNQGGTLESDPFCSSGVVTGVVCRWHGTSGIAGPNPDYGNAESDTAHLDPADKGAPVFDGTDRLLGMVTDEHFDGTHGEMTYLKLDALLRAARGYSLAGL
jgi:hypothetical protein